MISWRAHPLVTPVRLTLSRRRGFNLQEHSRAVNGLPAVKVDRSTKYGNPFIVGVHGTAGECVWFFELLLQGYECVSLGDDLHEPQQRWIRMSKSDIDRLRGVNLACWCPAGSLCHADVILRAVNAEAQVERLEEK